MMCKMLIELFDPNLEPAKVDESHTTMLLT